MCAVKYLDICFTCVLHPAIPCRGHFSEQVDYNSVCFSTSVGGASTSVFRVVTRYTKPGCHRAFLQCISGRSCLPACRWCAFSNPHSHHHQPPPPPPQCLFNSWQQKRRSFNKAVSDFRAVLARPVTARALTGPFCFGFPLFCNPGFTKKYNRRGKGPRTQHEESATEDEYSQALAREVWYHCMCFCRCVHKQIK